MKPQNPSQNNSKHFELLAPAGGIEQLKAAINFGADAVYLSGQQFGMRARAANFDDSQLKEAIEIAHQNQIKVYITINILMHQNDISQLKNYISFLAELKADAFIMGDLGAIALAREIAPNVDIHVSTQASVANSKAAEQYARMGAKRIVLAREMSIAQIEQMHNELQNSKLPEARNLQLEAFVHGAMCMSVSGRCLISSYLTGRSANKGHCTQPCRWGYSLQEENRPGQKFGIQEDKFGTYIMNSKDMNMLSHLHDLAKAGVSSFKIEGRNKKAMYVATTVNAYRHVIDSNFDPETAQLWEKELYTISHRPYSTGFYFGPAQQSPAYDGYEQECIHVADVLECEKLNADNRETPKDNKSQKSDNADNADNATNSDNIYKITVLCRNHFEQDQKIEALIPHQQPQQIVPKNLILTENITSKISTQKAKVANRAKEIYTFECNKALPKGSILRNREFLRTARK